MNGSMPATCGRRTPVMTIFLDEPSVEPLRVAGITYPAVPSDTWPGQNVGPEGAVPVMTIEPGGAVTDPPLFPELPPRPPVPPPPQPPLPTPPNNPGTPH